MPSTRYYSAKELAELWESNEHKVRRFLREQPEVAAPGKGGHYRIPAGLARKLERKFHRRYPLAA